MSFSAEVKTPDMTIYWFHMTIFLCSTFLCASKMILILPKQSNRLSQFWHKLSTSQIGKSTVRHH